MQRLSVLVFLTAVTYGGGVTKAPGISGISQFWTDDYKVFDQIYGKTSDKELYGATLPPSITYGTDGSSLRMASDKKERFLDNYGQNSDLDDDQTDAYGFGNRYPYDSLIKNEALKLLTVTAKKQTKPSLKFIATDFKPISQNSDPETYRYLKHLEELENQKINFPEKTLGGFKPYLSYSGTNPEDSDAYKSIQDILDAHEANKGKLKENEDKDEQIKYITYPPKSSRSKTPKSRAPPSVDKTKSRCPAGRCRKRATSSYRVYTRPYLRRIKHKIVY